MMANMTYEPSNPYISAAQGNGDVVVLNQQNVTADLVSKLGTLNVLYEIALDRTRFAENGPGQYMDVMIAADAARVNAVPGLMEHVAAVGLSEEWYLTLRGGGLDATPFFHDRG